MSRYDYVTLVLNEIGDEIGMGSLRLDDSNRVSLLFDEVLVTFTYVAFPFEQLRLHIELAEIAERDVPMMQQVAQVAMECWLNGVMTIALDKQGRKVVGHMSIPVSRLESNSLKDSLDGVLTRATAVREKLAQATLGETQTAAVTASAQRPKDFTDVASYPGWGRRDGVRDAGKLRRIEENFQ